MRPSPRRVIIDALFMSTTNYDRPVMDGSELDFAVLEDSEKGADAALRALERAGYEITEIVRYDDWEAKTFRGLRDGRTG